MTDDLPEPAVPPDGDEKAAEEDRTDDVADPEAQEALERKDDAPGIQGEEHLGLTPPD